MKQLEIGLVLTDLNGDEVRRYSNNKDIGVMTVKHIVLDALGNHTSNEQDKSKIFKVTDIGLSISRSEKDLIQFEDSDMEIVEDAVLACRYPHHWKTVALRAITEVKKTEKEKK